MLQLEIKLAVSLADMTVILVGGDFASAGAKDVDLLELS